MFFLVLSSHYLSQCSFMPTAIYHRSDSLYSSRTQPKFFSLVPVCGIAHRIWIWHIVRYRYKLHCKIYNVHSAKCISIKYDWVGLVSFFLSTNSSIILMMHSGIFILSRNKMLTKHSIIFLYCLIYILIIIDLSKIFQLKSYHHVMIDVEFFSINR